jgi:hypothetical protein
MFPSVGALTPRSNSNIAELEQVIDERESQWQRVPGGAAQVPGQMSPICNSGDLAARIGTRFAAGRGKGD